VSIARTVGSFDGVGNVRLLLRAWEVDAARAALLVVHGHGEHSGRYEDFAARMGEAGFSVYAFDLRGHGRSEGRRGHARSFDVLLQDVDRFRREVEGLIAPGTPLFLLGQSLGGLIVLRYVQELQPPVRGAVLVAGGLAEARGVERWETLLAPLTAKLLPALPFHTRLRAEDLSHDPAVVQAYRDDRYVHDVITPRLFAGISTAMGLAFQHADRVRVPLLLLLPGDDRVVNTPRSLAFARALPARDVETRVFPRLRHEPLNEGERGRVIAELRTWLAARIAASAGAAGDPDGGAAQR
jgi:alpha-beta hydrolase superfamily lysophospholipase